MDLAHLRMKCYNPKMKSVAIFSLFLAGCSALSAPKETPALEWHRLNLQMQAIADEQTEICKKKDPKKVWGFEGVTGPICVVPPPAQAPIAPVPAK